VLAPAAVADPKKGARAGDPGHRFEVGDSVTVTDGAFASLPASISDHADQQSSRCWFRSRS